jgi:short-subunit dehydrogenase
MELLNNKVFITGGSAGIGKALLAEFIRHGVRDIAVMGRNQDALDALKQEFPEARLLLIAGDVGQPADLDRAVATITREWKGLDILVNNAGVVSAGLLADQSDDDIISQININLTGLILLTKKALPLLLSSPEAVLMNISSGYGYLAMPFYSVYAATKAAIRQFSDAMRRELYQHPLHVMTVYPSATDTPMMKTAVVKGMDSAEDVARASLAGLLAGEINVIMGGAEREAQIKTNFLEPRKIDAVAVANYEALRERTARHRSM